MIFILFQLPSDLGRKYCIKKGTKESSVVKPSKILVKRPVKSS